VTNLLNETWPRDYFEEYKRRLKSLRKCAHDPRLQKALMKHYEGNIQDWINDWVITYNPRAADLKIMPFLLFRRQEEFLDFLLGCLRDKEGGLVEKSRDIGATWLCCAFSVWLWLFTPGASVGWGSRKEQLVDRIGDADSIFQKMRMILQHLPVWMLPPGFNIRKHATFMKIINPANGSAITGETGDNIGRGGRSQIYFKDESAHYERPELIEAALGDNTDVQIDISSVHGTANVFYRRRYAGEEWMPGKPMPKGKTRVFIFDWKHHPGKTDAWYEARRKKSADEGLLHLFAQEVDRDYAASIQGVIIPQKWVKAAIDAHIKLGLSPSGDKIAGQDVADEGGDKHALAIRHGIVLQYAEHWGEGDGGDAARKAVIVCAEHQVRELYYDCIGVGAAFKTESNRLKGMNQVPERMLIMPWNASASPLDETDNIIAGDYYTPTNENFFVNLKIQSWWRLRSRFEKTYKVLTQGAYFPPDELISLPSTLEDLHVIERELSQPVFKYNGVGKVLVDKKPEGAISPNLADAIVMCFNPARNVSILDVID
jgi:phage terminase large subunit